MTTKPLSPKQSAFLRAVANGTVRGTEFRLEMTFRNDIEVKTSADRYQDGIDMVWLDGRTIQSLVKRGLVEYNREIGITTFPVTLTNAGRAAL